MKTIFLLLIALNLFAIKYIDNKEYRYIIATADKQGYYYQAGVELSKYLPNSLVIMSEGSLQNFNLLLQNVVNIIFIQGDIYKYMLLNNPELKDKYYDIKLKRKEYIQIITRDDYNVDFSHLSTAFVGLPNSGGAGSWNILSKLDKRLSKIEINTGNINSITLTKVVTGEYDIIIRTSYIDEYDIIASQVADNHELIFNTFDYKKFTKKQNNVKLYKIGKVQITPGFFGKSVSMLYTNVHLLIDKKSISYDEYNSILHIIKKNKIFKGR